MLARLARNECIVHFGTVGLAKDGRTFAASVTVSPMRHGDNRRGRPLRRTARPSRANLPGFMKATFSAGNSRCDGESSSPSLAASQRRGRHQRRRSNPSGGGLATCGHTPKLTPIVNPGSEGRNLRLDYRWGASADNPDRIRRYAMELVALAPDVIVAGSGGIAVELKRTSRTLPIVFPTANDPVGVGLVESLQRPGGNATGFSGFESRQTEKFLELLKQIAPNVSRVAVIRNPTRGGGNANLGAIQAAALPLGVEVSPVDLRDVDAIERGVTVFAGAQNGWSCPLPHWRRLTAACSSRLRLVTGYQPYTPCAYSSLMAV
jgi:hypothetical protein